MDNGDTQRSERLNWAFGALRYSVIAVFVPGIFWVFAGFLCLVLRRLGDGASWFMDLPWSIKIPVFIVVGLSSQFCRPYDRQSDSNAEEPTKKE